MDEERTEHWLERYGDSLSDEEALAQLRPEIRDRLASYAARNIKMGKVRRAARHLMFGVVPLAAAACVVWLLLPREVMLNLVAVSGDPDGLFTRAEGTRIRDRFWVGVDVRRPCWVHLVERTAAGELVLMRPQASSDDYAVHMRERVRLGPFQAIEPHAPSGAAQVTHIIVIAASEALASDVLAKNVPDMLAPGESPDDVSRALVDLGGMLRREHGWEVAYQQIFTAPQ